MNRTLVLTILLISDSAASAVAGDIRSIELRRLFQPTESEQSAETQGRVYIYEGLREKDVERAMDEAFDRIQNMMFIRTQIADRPKRGGKPEEPGRVVVADDGC